MTQPQPYQDYVQKPEDLLEGGPITTLVKNCAAVLEKHYPNWLWAIQPEVKNGIINVYALRLSGKWGYTLHISNVQHDPNLRDVLKAGGEILERFGFRRVAYSYAEWSRREQVLGLFIPDVPDLSKFDQRRAKVERINNEIKHGMARFTADPNVGAALRSAGRA